MNKICTLIAVLLYAVVAVSQKANPTIGKKEIEISLFYLPEAEGTHLAGAQIVRRWSWKKYTKIGVGGLAGFQNHDPINESDVTAYGVLFGDITQFIGKRQKWSVGGQIGHGIFKREQEVEYANGKYDVKHTAGMYYSISFNYRSIISKKFLLLVSPNYTFRKMRQKGTVESYSPPWIEEFKLIGGPAGFGIRLGIVF